MKTPTPLARIHGELKRMPRRCVASPIATSQPSRETGSLPGTVVSPFRAGVSTVSEVPGLPGGPRGQSSRPAPLDVAVRVR